VLKADILRSSLAWSAAELAAAPEAGKHIGFKRACGEGTGKAVRLFLLI